MNRSHTSPAAPAPAAAAAAPRPPEGFIYSESNEHWDNDVALHEGPSRFSDELRTNITTSWCPADGTRLWIDCPPPEALTIDQATWLASALPEVLEEIGGSRA